MSKVQVRPDSFETNSSSTHSMVMAMRSDFDKWEKGELFYCDYFPWGADKSLEKKDSNFYTREEVDAIMASMKKTCEDDNKDAYEEYRRDHFQTYDEWCDTDYLEFAEDSITTPDGETIDVICKYGYDG